MKNEILESVWKVKEEIAKEYDYDIGAIARNLKKSENKKKKQVVNLASKKKKAA